MSRPDRCPACGALQAPGTAWCTLCFHRPPAAGPAGGTAVPDGAVDPVRSAPVAVEDRGAPEPAGVDELLAALAARSRAERPALRAPLGLEPGSRAAQVALAGGVAVALTVLLLLALTVLGALLG